MTIVKLLKIYQKGVNIDVMEKKGELHVQIASDSNITSIV